MVRVTVDDSGARAEPRIGVRGSGGRGAWVCPDAGCVEVAGARRGFSRALRSKLDDAHFAATLADWLALQAQS